MAAPYLQCALEVGEERGKQACGWAASLAGCAHLAWEQEKGWSHGDLSPNISNSGST